jgi:23S rRNA (guanine2445-N2)-methyltransferase / 23S rRNA (guanine2069-N7)-methyltransferase
MKPTMPIQFFASTAKGLEYLLVDELKSLGAVTAAEKLAGVEFTGDMAMAYRACLWSRLANRILLPLAKFPAETPEDLYDGVQTIDWNKHLAKNGTLAVKCVCTQSNITHTLYAAQKIKDAVVDQFRDKFQTRPNVDKAQPDISIHLYLYRNVATVSLDLSGESLHKRGYRLATGGAPLKETLAAAVLTRGKWEQIAKTGGALVDPMCGSGTLLIEGAMMAADIAPGLRRDYFGFKGWKQYQPELWEPLVREAEARCEQGMANLPPIIGYDEDPEAIHNSFDNIERAGLRGKIHVEKQSLDVFSPPPNTEPGLVVTNPPYGERMGEIEELEPLYTLLGDRLKRFFPGWQAAVFTGNPDLGKVMGLRARKFYALFNGAIPCKLLLFDVNPEKFIDRDREAYQDRQQSQEDEAE